MEHGAAAVVNAVNHGLHLLAELFRDKIAQCAAENEAHGVDDGVGQPIGQDVAVQFGPHAPINKTVNINEWNGLG